MAGETEEKPSGLTVDTLRLLIDARINEADRRYEQRFDAQEKTTAAAFVAAKEATSKAETAAERRLEGVNEFRGQLSDQAATFLTRSESEARLTALSEKVSDLQERVNQMTGRDHGMSDAQRIAIAVVAVIVAFAGLIATIVIATF